jgi:hypothetical protein
MRPVSQDVLRVLMAKRDSTNPELLALIQELTPTATEDFVMPRYPLYDVYKFRLGTAQDATEEAYEGMFQSVEAMAASPLANIRLLEVECLEGSCILFVEEDVKEVLGIIYFPPVLPA